MKLSLRCCRVISECFDAGVSEMTRVKICGVTRAADARHAVDAGAWAIGVNFWPHSKRHVDVDRAREISQAIAGAAPLVGVFVDEIRSEIERVVEEVPLDMVQLHGSESAEDCRGWSQPVIKSLAMRDANAWQEAASFPADFILADTYVAGQPGGTGRPIAVDLIGEGLRESLIVAGGLEPDTVAEVVRRIGPYAVDVASGVESEPGRKDAEKVKRFIENAQCT